VVSFSHEEAGTSERIWQQDGWPAQARSLVLDCARLLVVAAHPDDETLGAGGLIGAAAATGIPVSVIVATNGEASHPHSPTHTPADLAAVRRVEVVAAIRLLAPEARVRLLDLPDGDLAQHRNSLEEAVLEEMVAGWPGAGREEAAPATWLVAPWRQDGHPDHAVAGTAAALVAARTGARLLEYPIWAWHWSKPGDSIWPEGDSPTALWRLPLDPATRERKTLALSAHGSQVLPLSDRAGDEAIVQSAFALHFERDHEIFLSAAPDLPAPGLTAAQPPATATGGTLSADFFDDFYAGSRDPWGFETRWYEARKRAITLAVLPLARYSAALELGCSIGVLSRGIAERADTLLATDIALQPLNVARARLAGLPGVRVERRAVPAEWPPGSFDLIVVSEIGYYCSAEDLVILLKLCVQSLRPGGTLVACHWRHPVGEYPLMGDDVHAALAAIDALERTVRHVELDFVLEVYEPRPARSVAQRDGLVS
jgi:LmbE family N-acetylglucosaminyl deacetylase/SAM-dependent methyltransferase